MNKYVVLFSKIAAKELRHLPNPNEEIKHVYAKSKELESNPRPAECRKFAGEKRFVAD